MFSKLFVRDTDLDVRQDDDHTQAAILSAVYDQFTAVWQQVPARSINQKAYL
jgi:hypothetical protein